MAGALASLWNVMPMHTNVEATPAEAGTLE